MFLDVFFAMSPYLRLAEVARLFRLASSNIVPGLGTAKNGTTDAPNQLYCSAAKLCPNHQLTLRF